jgi:DNA (cytosine-5)-methyltransferase 1
VKPRAIDLFAGCGGLTVGLKQAGFEVVGAIEQNSDAAATYGTNHPEVRIWQEDIRKVPATTMMRELDFETGQLDLLSGCPPCQGFSTMRTLNGSIPVEDERNDLVNDFLRFAKRFLPKAVMMENVPGLAQDSRFLAFCKRLEKLGYFVRHRILDVSDYGVPQRRRRLILLAGYKSEIPFAPTTLSRRTVSDAIGSLPKAGESGDELHDLKEQRSPRIRELISRIPKDGGSRTDLPEDLQLSCHIRCNGFKDVYGRMAWDKPAPTITSGCFNPSKGRFLHPEEDRAITMREAALLQSFPAEYQFPLASKSKSGVALMIGNALPPEFVRRHATMVNKALSNSLIVSTD